MKMLKKSVVGAAVAVAAGFASTAALAGGVVIDLFNDPVGTPQTVSTATLGATDSNESVAFPASNVLGQYRDLTITKTADSIGGVNSGVSSLEAGDGVLSLSNADGNKSVAAVTWDGLDGDASIGGVNTTGLGGFDLTAGNSATGFQATVFSADLGFAYAIRVWDMDGSYAELSSAALFAVQPGVPDYAYYDFEWFNYAAGDYCLGATCPPSFGFSITRGGNGGDIDFSQIGALQLVLTDAGAFSVDFSVGTIETIPEPSALALVGLGLVGAAVAGRRRKSGQKA